MPQQEFIQIDSTAITAPTGLTYVYEVVINQQSTPVISLDGLRELRRLCDCYIALGESIARKSPSN